MASGKVRQRAAACENVFGDGVMRRKGSQETHALRRERVQSSGWEVRSRPPRHPCIVPPTVDQQYGAPPRSIRSRWVCRCRYLYHVDVVYLF
jgi:hypothetical protein